MSTTVTLCHPAHTTHATQLFCELMALAESITAVREHTLRLAAPCTPEDHRRQLQNLARQLETAHRQAEALARLYEPQRA